MTPTRRLLTALVPLVGASSWGCVPRIQENLGPQVPRMLTETQATLVIDQALHSNGASAWRNQAAALQGVGDYTLDFLLRPGGYGIEWLTETDRDRNPEAVWPVVDEHGPLQVLEGQDEARSSALQILVLDRAAYTYEGNPRWVQRGAPGIDHAEERVRNDVRDFIHYVDGQDTLMAPRAPAPRPALPLPPTDTADAPAPSEPEAPNP